MQDTRGGFIVEESSESSSSSAQNTSSSSSANNNRTIPRESILANINVLDPSDNPKCIECESIDIDAILLKHFHIHVCKKCKETHSEKYALLTKTECKSDYLLTLVCSSFLSPKYYAHVEIECIKGFGNEGFESTASLGKTKPS
jgi:DNA-repair protein complementing XP-A cells